MRYLTCEHVWFAVVVISLISVVKFGASIQRRLLTRALIKRKRVSEGLPLSLISQTNTILISYLPEHSGQIEYFCTFKHVIF